MNGEKKRMVDLDGLTGHIKDFMTELITQLDQIIGEYWKARKLSNVNKEPLMDGEEEVGGQLEIHYADGDTNPYKLSIRIKFVEDGEI